jgi:hypothetical protein
MDTEADRAASDTGGRAPEAGPQARRWLAVLWPAFLAAAALEGVVFAWVDPEAITVLDGALGLSRTAVYSLAFFVFWAISAAAAALAVWLATGQPPRQAPAAR